MNKTLLLFATKLEASSLLEPTYTQKAENLYAFPNYDLLITGMGSFAAMASLSCHLTQYQKVISCGFAGSLDASCTLGQVYTLKSIERLSLTPLSGTAQSIFEQACPVLHPLTTVNLPAKRGLTTDFPLHTTSLPEITSRFDLVDMESYGVEWVCQSRKLPCLHLRVISDFCSATTSASIKEHAQTLSTILSKALQNLL